MGAGPRRGRSPGAQFRRRPTGRLFPLAVRPVSSRIVLGRGSPLGDARGHLRKYLADPIEVDLRLVLAIDVSRSVDAEEYELQKDGYARALNDRPRG